MLQKNARRLDRLSSDAFQRSVEDPAVGMAAKMEVDSRTLLIAFGGMQRAQAPFPPFEFFSMTQQIQTKKLFVRDVRQAWYHKGIPGYGDSLEESAAALSSFISGHDVDRIVAVGASAGGYAAFIFGTLLGAERVMTFGPQTVIDPDKLSALGDHRWDEPLQRLAAEGVLDSRWSDLAIVLPRLPRTGTRYEIYFSEHNAKPGLAPGRDRLHAERLRDLEGVRLYRFGHNGHLIAAALRDNGAMGQILHRALHLSEETPDQ